MMMLIGALKLSNALQQSVVQKMEIGKYINI
jgi:hypothetical protein